MSAISISEKEPFIERVCVPDPLKEDMEYYFSNNDFEPFNIPNIDPFVKILEFLTFNKDQTNYSLILEESIRFWKRYKKSKMDAFMKLSKFIDPDVLSRSPFLSIETIKEHHTFKWNWVEVTNNAAISLRDIVKNPSLAWARNVLVDRDGISKEILDFFRISTDGIHYNIPLKTEWSQFDLLISPEDPVLNYNKFEDEIDENLINEVIGQLMDQFPSFFEGISDNLLDECRKLVIENIQENGEFFLDSFQFPAESDDYFKEELILEVCEPTEDDPYALRNLIFKLEKHDYFKFLRAYKKITNLETFNSPIHPKNRKEFIQFLHISSYNRDFERSIFFELEDIDSFPNLFFNKSSIILSSGKLSFDKIISSNDKYGILDLVKYLPFDYVFKNLLFIKDIQKLGFVKIEPYHKNAETLEKHTMKIFCSRDDFNYDYYIEYPDIPWDFSEVFNTPLFLVPYGRISDKLDPQIESLIYNLPLRYTDLTEEHFSKNERYLRSAILNTMVWSDFKTKRGFEILIGKDDSKDMFKITDSNIMKKIKHFNDEYEFIITPELIQSNIKIKWNIDIKVDFNDLVNEYLKHASNLVGIFFILPFIQYNYSYLFNLKKKMNKAMFFLLKRKIEKENSNFTYDKFVELIPMLQKILFDAKDNYSLLQIEFFDLLFPIEYVRNTKYTYFSKIIKSINKSNE
uniref:Uncharacterized protein n=1 Tax=viral metagenome TaxID=1070528 RepID=A0A6C0BCJ8_9ZZZZ